MLKEALVLGLALTFSNIAAGIAAGLAGLDITLTTVATFTTSFLLLLLGQIAGEFVLFLFDFSSQIAPRLVCLSVFSSKTHAERERERGIHEHARASSKRRRWTRFRKASTLERPRAAGAHPRVDILQN